MDEPQKQIKAVIFDLGETLLNFGRIRNTYYFRRGARESYDFLKSLDQPVSNFEYYCWKNLLILRLYAFRSAVTGNDFDSLEVLKKIGTKKGYRMTEPQWQEFVWLWYKPLQDICQAEPDIIQTLTKLKDAGLKLGILSNTFVNACALENL
ncbi:MAG: HAD family hydrolase [Planctomycetota bacterium]